MKTINRALASLLAVVMLVCMLPTAAFAGQTEGTPDEVIYNLLDMPVTVGTDEARTESEDELYFLFEEDGSFDIWLEDNAFFPYEVQFTYGGETWSEWFMTPDDTVEVGGHTFTVTSNVTDPEALLQLGVKVGEDYIPAYPAAKEFTTEPQMSTFSLMPLRTVDLNLDLYGYFPAELAVMSIEAVLGEGTLGEGDRVLWTKYDYYDEDGNYVEDNGDFTLVTDGTLDLTTSEPWYDDWFQLEMIVGTVDQLNMSNTRYVARVRTSGFIEMLSVSIYSADDPREEIPSHHNYIFDGGGIADGKNLFEFSVDEEDWDEGEEVYLGLSFSETFDATGLDVTVFEGYYNNKTELQQADAKCILDQIWDQTDLANSGGYLGDFSWKRGYEDMKEITIIFQRNGEEVQYMPMILYMWGQGISMGYSSMFAEAEDGGNWRDYVTWDKYFDNYAYQANGYKYEPWVYEMKEGYPADGTYYFDLAVHMPDDTTAGVELIKKAVVGYYKTEAAIPANAEDIKEQLFSNARIEGGGYAADFSKGVMFTIVDIRGQVHNCQIKTVEYVGGEEITDENKMLEIGLNGVGYERGVDVNSGYVWFSEFDSYEMPEEADSYYANGYRTVFLYDETPDSEFYNIVPDVEVWPVIGYMEEETELYLGHDGTSGEKYVYGETTINLKHNEPLNLSTVWNGKVKNYWVTYLTQQKGPSLFVNATNDESRYVNVAAEGEPEDRIPQREVFLTEANSYHDVFFANVGDEEITGLYVRLENAQNVALDEYWTINETTTLAAFTSADENEMYNMGKIRLVPAKDENGNELSGPISGTLVIGYTGNTGNDDTPGGGDNEIGIFSLENSGEEVRISLTGTAGTPKITTESLADATQHVPYEAIIQTNNMTSSNATFTLSSGKLPNGLTLEKNGEITGVPSQAGEFTFTVKAVFNNDNSKSDTKEFTLTVLEDTPENIEAVNKGPNGYEIEEHLGTEVTGEDGKVSYELNMKEVADEDLVFVSEGEFDEFVDFYIDSKKLTRDVDYTAEEGSTKITVRAQAFKKAGNGQHVIAAAFNSGGTLKKTAQSVTITGATKAATVKEYKITVEPAVNGTITCARTSAREKELVVATVRPAAGYIVKSVSAGNGVYVAARSGNEYWITMPAADVTISAVFEAIEQPSQPSGGGGGASQPSEPSQPEQPSEPEQPEIPFGDVAAEDAFYEAVKFVYENGIMVGTGENTFAPDANLSRAMVVQVLYNYEKQPEVAAGTDFADVAEGQWYTSAVRWATEKGVVAGYGDGTFGTDDDVTIEQVAVILWNYAGQPVAEGETVPAESSQWAVNALDWCAKQGVLVGVDAADTTVAATRAQTAQILMNFLSKLDRQ